MGLTYDLYLEVPLVYRCKTCTTHLSDVADLISKSFRGQHGKAYLFGQVVNVTLGESQSRSMTTGVHIVRDISCRRCHSYVGWKYEKAEEDSEKYKEGKYILEAALLSTAKGKSFTDDDRKLSTDEDDDDDTKDII